MRTPVITPVYPRPRLIMLEPSAKPKPESKPLFLLESTPLPVAKTLTTQTRSKDLVRFLELKEQEESGAKTMSPPRTLSIEDLDRDVELNEQDEGGRRRRLSFPNDNSSTETSRRAAERRHRDGTVAEKASKARRPREAARRKFQRNIRQEVKWVQPYYKSTAMEAAASKLLFVVAVGLYLMDKANNKEEMDMTRLLVDQCIQTYRKWLLCGVWLSVVLFCWIQYPKH